LGVRDGARVDRPHSFGGFVGEVAEPIAVSSTRLLAEHVCAHDRFL
jgi:hypothetical protein